MKVSKRTYGIAIFSVILSKHFSIKLEQKWLGKNINFSPNEEIASWAVDFFDNHQLRYSLVNISKGIFPLSPQIKVIKDMEDCLIDFGYYNLNKY